MNSKLTFIRSARVVLLALMYFVGGTAATFASAQLQGQNKGDTNTWSTVNLQDWKELDFIPFRVSFSSGSAGSQTINLDFTHLSGNVPGFEDMYYFTNYTSNIVFTSGPTLTTDPSGEWHYSFTVQISDNNPAEIRFFARVAAGSHLNGGSSLHLNSNVGNVQIHKIDAGPAVPDLAITKTGPSTIPQGGTIIYTMSYTNKASTNAVGVQISDFLPAQVVVDTNTLPVNAHLVGDNIFFDLTNVAAHASGQVSFQALVPLATAAGTVISNFSQILSSETESNMGDNKSSWLTTVTTGCTAAVVTNAPANSTNCPGTTAFFAVGASGTGLTYQWYKGVNPLANKTNNTLTISGITATDAGNYSVVVQALCGSPVTNSALLVVNDSVSVSVPPSNSTNCPGTMANFSVTATGTGLAYQWYKGVNPLLNQTNSTLTLAGVTGAEAGTYSVVVSGICGNAVTNSAVLVVNANVNVSMPPSNSTNCPGTIANFSVSATGTGLAYQWYKGTNPLANKTNSTLTLSGVTSGDAGTYSVVVSGACGNSLTNSALLVVNDSVLVSVPPSNSTNCPGTTANFNVTASGTALTYQWYKGTTLLAGETNSTLSLAGVTSANAGSYKVVVSGACGTAITNSALLVVNDPVLVSVPPSNSTNCPGTTANFNVTASGTSLTYQWYKGTNLLVNETNSTLSLGGVTSVNAGTYKVVVGGACGAAITNSALLVVNDPVLVSVPPSNSTNCPGTTANLSVSASGTGLTYQWYKGVNPLLDQTNSTLTLSGVTGGDAGSYSVIVSGACGNAITNSALLVVNENLVVSLPPSNSTNCPGTTANFSVVANGTGLSYQWYKGVNSLLNQTNSTLTLSGVTGADAGTYSVVVSGLCGNAITNSAQLIVNEDVLVNFPPMSTTNCPGTIANFSVSATGTGLAYQWYKGIDALLGQTNNTLTLTNVSAGDEAAYTVIVSGVCGTAVTNSALLVVNENGSITSGPFNSTNCPGTTAIFSVVASGTGVSFQWYSGTNLLANETNNTLTLTNVTATDAGTYSVVVSGVCGSAVTNSALLVVNENVSVVQPPVNSTNCPGTTASFSVSAGGTGLSYQWYKGVNALLNQTNSTLTLNGVSGVDADTYSVTVSGLCGEPVSASALLVVNDSVVVTVPPSNATNCPGTTANFSVSATGTGLIYQWYKGQTLLSETGNVLTLSGVTADDAGIFTVVVSGICGEAITNSALLVVNENVNVSQPPVNSTNCPGATANFSVNASGTGLSYQWYKGQTLLSATGSTLTLNNVSAGDAGVYTVVVSGVCGNAITNSAELVVNANVSVAPLANVTKNIGQSVVFTAVASGTGPFNYQWSKNSNPLNGETNSTLTLTNLTINSGGLYSVQVSGACGEAVATGATLVMNQPPTVTITQPTNNSVFIAPATFTVLASASDPDGTVTNVEFFTSTNGVDFVKVWETNAGPYFVVLSNLTTGSYTLKARATDDLGATGDSDLVNVTVITQVPFSFRVKPIDQAGYNGVDVTVTNLSPFPLPGLRFYVVGGLSNGMVVANVSGTNNGQVFVDLNLPVQPGVTTYTNALRIYNPTPYVAQPEIRVEVISGGTPQAPPSGTLQAINRGLFLNNGTFLVEFSSASNKTYYIEYSSNLVSWQTVFPGIKGNGTKILWIDSGPPATESFPSINTARYYRVRVTQ